MDLKTTDRARCCTFGEGVALNIAFTPKIRGKGLKGKSR